MKKNVVTFCFSRQVEWSSMHTRTYGIEVCSLNAPYMWWRNSTENINNFQNICTVLISIRQSIKINLILLAILDWIWQNFSLNSLEVRKVNSFYKYTFKNTETMQIKRCIANTKKQNSIWILYLQKRASKKPINSSLKTIKTQIKTQINSSSTMKHSMIWIPGKRWFLIYYNKKMKQKKKQKKQKKKQKKPKK